MSTSDDDMGVLSPGRGKYSDEYTTGGMLMTQLTLLKKETGGE